METNCSLAFRMGFAGSLESSRLGEVVDGGVEVSALSFCCAMIEAHDVAIVALLGTEARSEKVVEVNQWSRRDGSKFRAACREEGYKYLGSQFFVCHVSSLSSVSTRAQSEIRRNLLLGVIPCMPNDRSLCNNSHLLTRQQSL
jgi:hypothetical protein